MEQSSSENAKISDSGYSHSRSNSQSQGSTDGSRNSNRSESSGYCGGHPSALSSSNEALTSPNNVEKEKEHQKKKLKTTLASNVVENDICMKSIDAVTESSKSYALDVSSTKPTSEKQTEEKAVVELVDVTDAGEHNGNLVSVDAERGVGLKSNSLDESCAKANDGFCAVVSMLDGLVVYTTPSLCTVLGYPRDSWVGCSFIDFIHPRDKTIFADKIASGFVTPADQRSKDSGQRTGLFCGLRKFTGTLEEADEEMSSLYTPFHLTLTYREQQPETKLLVVEAKPVHSAYKAPEETIISTVFTTRHDASCHLLHVDPNVVRYFGYLPQEMIGHSLFDFYHPEDLPYIKDIYEAVIRMEGSSFRSKPYRFAVQNGGYVVLETEWSSFVNPWTRKLEFVAGQHRVLKGPIHPDVFRALDGPERANALASISEEVLKEAKIIQNEIQSLLNETVQRKSDVSKAAVSERCKYLKPLMESLLQEMDVPEMKTDPATTVGCFSEHDSVMLGEISPYHEYCDDSKSSTETPPSYNQLNYNESIERFFKSDPRVTTCHGSDEENVNAASSIPSNDEGGKTSSASGARKCMSPVNGSGESGSGSGENLSNEFNNQRSSVSRGENSNSNPNRNGNWNGNPTGADDEFKSPTLTEILLNKHNENMKILMMQKHREQRSSIKNGNKTKDSKLKPGAEKTGEKANRCVNHAHGVKRCRSRSREGGNFKVPKHEETRTENTVGPLPVTLATTMTNMSSPCSEANQGNNNVTLWPTSSSAPSMVPPQPCIVVPQPVSTQEGSRHPLLSHMLPVYYLPVPQQGESPIIPKPSHDNRRSSIPQTILENPYLYVAAAYIPAALPGVTYPSVFGSPAMLPAVSSMMYRPFPTSKTAPVSRETPQIHSQSQSPAKKPVERRMSASQVTTCARDAPESSMAVSESLKKVLSPRQLSSSCFSNDGGCSSVLETLTPSVDTKTLRQAEDNGDESSSSSLYSSFLNKSSESSCNPNTAPTTESPSKRIPPHQGMLPKEPPWLEGVKVTRELIYEYQIQPKELSDVLQRDMEALKQLHQPALVNNQLNQLYLDLELEGFGTKLILEDDGASSESSNDDASEENVEQKQIREMIKHQNLAMIYEENAPLPPTQLSQEVRS